MTSIPVSVLIPVYNREKYLSSTIESVLDQSFKDFELIIVDDGSKDSTIDIARSYDDKRIKVFENKQNLGQFQNRNFAASIARGKYLKYVDSDDIIYPHCLEIMLEGMKRFPNAGIGLSKKPRLDILFPCNIDSLQAYREEFLGSGLLANAPTSSIFLREAFEKCGRFPTESIISDVLLLYKIAARRSVVLLTGGLAWYRVHGSQVPFYDTGYNKIIIERVRYLADILFSSQCPLPRKEQDIAYSNIVGNVVRYCLRLLVTGKFNEYYRSWKASKLPLKAMKFGFIRPSYPCRIDEGKSEKLIYRSRT